MVAGEHTEVPLAPHLREVIGGIEGQNRWADLLAARSRTAREFQTSWEALRAEAVATWQYLEEEPGGALSARLEEVGGSCVDGSTCSKLVQQREGMRHLLLMKALKRHPDKEARPVTVFPNIAEDKCAGSGYWQPPVLI